MQYHSLPATKPYLLPARPEPVSRPWLSVGLDGNLTHVSAPAGSGKTALVTQWPCAQCPSTWLSLDETDNDAIHRPAYSVAAFRAIHLPLARLSVRDQLTGECASDLTFASVVFKFNA